MNYPSEQSFSTVTIINSQLKNYIRPLQNPQYLKNLSFLINDEKLLSETFAKISDSIIYIYGGL